MGLKVHFEEFPDYEEFPNSGYEYYNDARVFEQVENYFEEYDI